MKNGIGVTWLEMEKYPNPQKSKNWEIKNINLILIGYQIAFIKVYHDHLGVNTCNMSLRHNSWISDLVVWVRTTGVPFQGIISRLIFLEKM